MSSFKVASAATVPLNTLCDVTNRGFTGYFVPVNHTPEAFSAFCRQFSVDLAASQVLLTEDQQVVAIALLGVRGSRGWCGGFAVVPEARRQGAGYFLADALADRAAQLGMDSIMLEVMIQNTAAVKIYSAAGFTISRDLALLGADISVILPRLPLESPRGILVRPVTLPEALHTIDTVDPGGPIPPCWQREAATIYLLPDIQCITATKRGAAEAAMVYRDNVRTQQIGILALAFRDEVSALALLAEALRRTGRTSRDGRTKSFSVLNEPMCTPLWRLLVKLGFLQKAQQHEMAMIMV